MPSVATLSRTLLIALATLALCAPAAVARPDDAPTSSFRPLNEWSLERQFDPYPTPVSDREAALAQERSYSTHGEPAPQRVAATTAATDSGDGITWVPVVLGLVAALAVGMAAGSGLHARRHATRLAT